jgi:uncharacterized protein YtpQ (UPF0354 family)
VGLIAEDPDEPYEASRLLVPEMWKPLVDAAKGQLIVSAPGADVLLFRQLDDGTSIEELRAQTRVVATQVARPISETIFRWTPAGFEPLKE